MGVLEVAGNDSVEGECQNRIVAQGKRNQRSREKLPNGAVLLSGYSGFIVYD